MKQIAYFFVIAGLLTGGGASGAQNRQTVSLLRKNAQVENARKLAPRLTIRLNRWQPNDVLNLRPQAGAQIAATAGSLREAYQPGVAAPLPDGLTGLIKPAAPLPDAALSVTAGTVIFNHPEPLENIIFLDIKIPEEATVEVFVNGEKQLQAALRQPLALQAERWGTGESDATRTMMRAAGLASNTSQIFYNSSQGRYVAPSARLHIITQTALKGAPGASAVVKVDIDENGRVVQVTSLTNSAIVNLQESLMKWRFAPFVLDGRPVPVTTVLYLTVR